MKRNRLEHHIKMKGWISRVISYSKSALLLLFLLIFCGELFPLEQTADFVQIFTPVLEEPFSAVTGDFNEDGHTDVAVGNNISDMPYITTFLGNGLGGFPLVSHFPFTGSKVMDIVVDDFNDDDHLDVCSVSMLSETVSLLTGDGEGHLTETGNFDTGSFPEYLTVGDFDENGYPDITMSHWVTGQISVMLNDSQGGFLPPEFYTMYGGGPKEIDIGDFNEDDHLDLAIATMTFNFVLILYGDGSGSFGQMDSVYVDYDAFVVRVADYTHDEHDDIAVGTKHSFLLLKGDGEGGFERTSDISVTDPHAICARDFNEDGNLDAAVSMTQGNLLDVYLGDGEGGFMDHVVHKPLHSAPRSLDYEDFNEDGHLDLVSANEGSDNICLMINQVGLIELTSYKTRSIYAAGDKATFIFNVSNPQDTTVEGTIWFTIKQGANEQLVHPSLLNGQENPWAVTIPPGFTGDLSVKLSITEQIQRGFYQFYVNSGQPGTPNMENLVPGKRAGNMEIFRFDEVIWSSVYYPLRIIDRFSIGNFQPVDPIQNTLPARDLSIN